MATVPKVSGYSKKLRFANYGKNIKIRVLNIIGVSFYACIDYS